jgi:hypothetical protein
MGVAEKPYRPVQASDFDGGVACAGVYCVGLIFATTKVHAGYELTRAATVSAASPVRDPAGKRAVGGSPVDAQHSVCG